MSVGGATLLGDLLMVGAAILWAAFTVLSRDLVLKYGAVPVTTWTLWIGTVGLAAVGAPALSRTAFASLPGLAWGAVAYAGLLALAYVAWYRGVERLGSARTAVYSNLVPVAALLTAWIWLGQAPNTVQWLGAAVVIGSLTLTRLTPERSPSEGPAAVAPEAG